MRHETFVEAKTALTEIRTAFQLLVECAPKMTIEQIQDAGEQLSHALNEFDKGLSDLEKT